MHVVVPVCVARPRQVALSVATNASDADRPGDDLVGGGIRTTQVVDETTGVVEAAVSAVLATNSIAFRVGASGESVIVVPIQHEGTHSLRSAPTQVVREVFAARC